MFPTQLLLFRIFEVPILSMGILRIRNLAWGFPEQDGNIISTFKHFIFMDFFYVEVCNYLPEVTLKKEQVFQKNRI